MWLFNPSDQVNASTTGKYLMGNNRGLARAMSSAVAPESAGQHIGMEKNLIFLCKK